jgi:formylglycine-generating enzyme required for sulfatase activity
VLVRAGAFTMGDAAGDEEEKPHDVTLTKDFWMGVTEVTQAQWQAVAGSNPSSVKGAELPVTNVSWDDVQEFLKKLAPRVKDRAPGLPTEAEWEYACRAGTKTQWSCGDTDAQIDASAWTNRTSGGTPQPAGRKAPNAWGLHDMSGNVWEWCADWYGPYEAKGTDPTGPSTGTDRVVRGGSWDSKPSLARSAARYWGAPDERSGTIGLRVVLR